MDTRAKSCAIQVWRVRWLDGNAKSDPLVERVRPILPPYPLGNQRSREPKSEKDSCLPSSNTAVTFECFKAIQMPIEARRPKMLNKLKRNDI
jgi:hypothetical protein